MTASNPGSDCSAEIALPGGAITLPMAVSIGTASIHPAKKRSRSMPILALSRTTFASDQSLT